MERGRKYIYFFFNGFISFSSSFFLSIVSSGSEQQTITHTRLIRRALCGVLRRSRVGAWSNFLFLFLYFYGVRIYFYEAISKLKRSISLVERRNGEEEGRSVMMRGGGGEALLHQWFTTLEKWHACEHLDGKGYDPSGICQQHLTQNGKRNKINGCNSQNDKNGD